MSSTLVVSFHVFFFFLVFLLFVLHQFVIYCFHLHFSNSYFSLIWFFYLSFFFFGQINDSYRICKVMVKLFFLCGICMNELFVLYRINWLFKGKLLCEIDLFWNFGLFVCGFFNLMNAEICNSLFGFCSPESNTWKTFIWKWIHQFYVRIRFCANTKAQ